MSSINDSATITYRSVKETPLTNNEVDANFQSLDDTKLPSNNPTITGLLTMQQATELIIEKTGATGVVVHDFSTGAIFFHSSIAANFTVNLTNFPTTSDRAIAVTLVLDQGGTGYIPNALQINGGAQTIRWANDTTPPGSSSKIDIVTFSIVRAISTWFVMAQLLPFA